MNFLFLAYLQNELGLSLLILLLLLIAPLLAKYYKASSRYYMWLVLLIALIVPYHFTPMQTLWPINISPLIGHNTWSQTQTSKPILEHQLDSWQESNTLPNTLPSENLDTSDTSSDVQLSKQTHNERSPIEPIITSLHNTLSQYTPYLFDYLIWIWFAGFILSIVYTIFSHIRFIHFSRKWCTPITDPKLLFLIDSLQAKLNLSPNPHIQYCKLLNTPITVGILKPIILLPCIDFDEQELSLLLTHEMIHCKRKDIWYKAFINLVQAIHWYNPIIYLMKSRIYLDCETSCDELVLLSANEDIRLHYGEIIIDIIRHPNIKVSALSSAFLIEKKKIKERLNHIMNTNIKHTGKILITFIIVLTISSTVLCGFTQDVYPSNVNYSAYPSSGSRQTIDVNGNYSKVQGNIDSDKDLANYISKTNDIGALFTNIDHLSQNTIDSIMISYIKRTNDIGMVFSAMDYLSQSAIDQIAKNYASSSSDLGMIETLRPYVSNGVLPNTTHSASSFTKATGNWMDGIIQMHDFLNTTNVSESVPGSFYVSDEEELVVFSTMKSGKLSFNLFSPDNKQVLKIAAKEVDQTIKLSPGRWTYNYTLKGSNGLALIVARKKSQPIDIVMQNFELHK